VSRGILNEPRIDADLYGVDEPRIDADRDGVAEPRIDTDRDGLTSRGSTRIVTG